MDVGKIEKDESFFIKVDNVILRYCPFCNYPLCKEDFFITNRDIEFGEACRLWENSNVAIPCCDCFGSLIEIVELTRYDHDVEPSKQTSDFIKSVEIVRK